MKCDELKVLLHALIDDELDAGHAQDVETHVAGCSACAAQLASYRAMHEFMGGGALKETAPAHLRSRVEASLTLPASRVASMRSFFKPTRRSFFGGFAFGSPLARTLLWRQYSSTPFEEGASVPKNSKRVPSALKHGIYSCTDLLPTESRTKFRKFRRQIFAELNLLGRLEQDIGEQIVSIGMAPAKLFHLRLGGAGAGSVSRNSLRGTSNALYRTSTPAGA
jgi:hypothetical protein